jgi:hypothetical protein
MANEKQYPKGLIAFKPNSNAPYFVKASVVISPNTLLEWLQSNQNLLTDYKGSPQLKLQLLENDKGLYFAVDTYKKQEPAF